jgi:hypothetical protein
MPVDLSGLQTSIDALAAEATATEGVEGSAVLIIQGFSTQISKAVTDALTADAAANATSIKAANDAISAVTAKFVASRTKLGDAIAANQTA